MSRRPIVLLAAGVAVLVTGVVAFLLTGTRNIGTTAVETAELKVYGPDPKATRLEVDFTVSVPESVALLDRVALLARKLSEHRFMGLPVELVGIDSSSGRRIATINLAEDPGTGHSWRTGFFQGSTGGHFTTASLVETFLQPDYRGAWLAGVRFLYGGQPVTRRWDHIDLDRTWLRTDSRYW